VKEEFIQYSPHNKHRRYKDLAELAAQNKDDRQAQELATAADNQQAAIRESKARLATQTGADNETGGYDTGTSGNKPAFYQLGSVHDIARKQRLRERRVYADHTRTSVKDNTSLAEIHP
jgi:hypothetical protein